MFSTEKFVKIKYQRHMHATDLIQEEVHIKSYLDNENLSDNEREEYIKFLLQTKYTFGLLKSTLANWEKSILDQQEGLLKLYERNHVCMDEQGECEKIEYDNGIKEYNKQLDAVQAVFNLSIDNLRKSQTLLIALAEKNETIKAVGEDIVKLHVRRW